MARIKEYRGVAVRNPSGKISGWTVTMSNRVCFGTFAEICSDIDQFLEYGSLPAKQGGWFV